MAADVSDEAVVLRRSDSGESDRRLTLLTAHHGKLDVVAKGARKPGSRLAGSSEPLVNAVFTWAEGRNRRFVTQVQPLSSFPQIRADYDKSLAALALAELTAKGVPYESPAGESESLYEMLRAALSALDGAVNWKAALVWAETRMMEAEGVHPAWTTCAVTGRPLAENPAWVSPLAGGHVVADVAGQYDDRFQASAESLIALSKSVSLPSAPPNVKGADECLRVLFAFWRHSLDDRLPANETLVRSLTS